jgi:GT2 family glycosyltransferase
MDYDTMILTPITFMIIEKAIEKYPDTALFGAMCNRVSYSHQRLLPQPDENDSIRHHTRIAIEQAEKYPNGECKDAKSIAGFFMLFRKSYWEKSPFQENIFDDRNNLFDYSFSRYAVKNKLPIRVILGSYVFHSYRILKESYKDLSHLRTFHADGSTT